MRTRAMQRLAGVGVLVVLGSVPAVAQDRDSLAARLALPALPTQVHEAPPAPPPARYSLIFPGITISSPAAVGAEGGTVYVGAGFQERTRYLRDDDGVVFGGVGLGDARRYAGVELMLTSLSTVRTGIFDRVGLSAQVHRELSRNTAVAVGVENLVMVNGEESDTDRSAYAVVTRLVPLRRDPAAAFSIMGVTLGAGNGRFRSEDDVFADRETIGVFGSLSLHVVRPVALIADWTGQDLALGASLAPFSRFPLVITPAFMDVTRTAGDGARFVIAVGVGYRVTRGPIQF